jgi:hypothetical protein
MDNQHWIKIGLLFIIIGDLVFAWLQYVGMPIDGDLYAIVLPAPWYEEVLLDPFGWEALFSGKEYGGAGRYSAHQFTSLYFNHMPGLFQYLASPIDSIYYSSALAKCAAHLSLLLLLSAYVCGHLRVFRKEFLWTMIAVIPFLQVHGMRNRFGLIDNSITYTLFYIVPLIIIFALLFPLYRYFIGRRQMGTAFTLGWWTLPWLATLWIAAFWGPQSQVVMLLIGGLALLGLWINGFRQHKTLSARILHPFRGNYSQLGLLLVALVVFGGLGYLTGTQNSENVASLPLRETLIQAAKGIKFHFVEPWPIWGVGIFLGIHIYRLNRLPNPRLKLWRKLFIMILIGIAIYMLMIPFGGYRSYRPLLYRYDLLIPVTLSWVFLLLWTGRLVIQEWTSGRNKTIYLISATLFLVILHLHDLKIKDGNACEKGHLNTLQSSEEDVIVLPADCPILGWEPDDNLYYTEKKVELLRRWNILDRHLVYTQE